MPPTVPDTPNMATPSRSRPVGAEPVLQALRSRNGHLAAGHVMALMMRHPAFADRTFGGMATMIAGQVNRGHYFLLYRGRQPCGVIGWALCSMAAGRKWLAGDGSEIGDGRQGDCAVLNVWVTDGPEMNAFARSTLRDALRDQRLLVARRIYTDGRIRPVILDITWNGQT